MGKPILVASTEILTHDLLERCRSRASQYDEENRFCQEDFDELKAAGYLNIPLPEKFGGLGMHLLGAGRQTRRLAHFAPATALCLNMHNYWVGVAADLWRAGDKSLEWVLMEAAKGEVFAAGHAEHGNETSILMSITKADPAPGGYAFTGRKSFGSLSPVWTRLGLHGLDTSDPDHPKVVHGFLARDSKGYTIRENWDVMGMRATRSDDTILEGAFVPESRIARVLPMGFAGADNFLLSVFAWALMGFANVYIGLAQRALDLTREHLLSRGSLALTRPLAWHPEYQHGIAEMVMELEAIIAQVEAVGRDWSDGVAHPDWPIKIVAAKYRAVEGAWKIVDRAMDLSGGFGMSRKGELERLFRDARAGRFHPANGPLTHEVVGKLALGLNPDEMPRWG
jgi:alkylation response protein AidB-like acyl-CoA dehydrogenase